MYPLYANGNELLIWTTWFQLAIFVGPALIALVKLEWNEHVAKSREVGLGKWQIHIPQPAH